MLTDQAKRSGRRTAPASINGTVLRHKTRNRQEIGTQKASQLSLLSELHDAYVLCICEQLDFFAACGNAAEHDYENEHEENVKNILAAKGGLQYMGLSEFSFSL